MTMTPLSIASRMDLSEKINDAPGFRSG